MSAVSPAAKARRLQAKKEYYARLRRENPVTFFEQRQNQRRLVRYGVTKEKFDELVAEQKGLCFMCLKPLIPGKHITVDHCHRSSKVRGIAHRGCNAAVGWLGDTPESLRKIADILEAAERREK